MLVCVSAVILIGTLLIDSARRVAVTTTSCSAGPVALSVLPWRAGGTAAAFCAAQRRRGASKAHAIAPQMRRPREGPAPADETPRNRVEDHAYD